MYISASAPVAPARYTAVTEIFENPEFWARWFGIVVLDLSLGGDNALLIAMAVRTLPPREQFLGRIGGTLGAVALVRYRRPRSQPRRRQRAAHRHGGEQRVV